MRPVPPANLVERLDRFHLARPAQVVAAGARVRKLAGELWEFESVWIDALAQAKVLTPWQAAELNAGRGERLVCGSYVLLRRLSDLGSGECYLARHFDSHDLVRLYRCPRPQRPPAETLGALANLIDRARAAAGLHAIFDAGTDGRAVWAAAPSLPGLPASEWLAENGRLPPAAVLQIARAMIHQLAELERHGVVHGDLSASNLLLDGAGDVALQAPGLRAIVRPQEGLGFAELRPEAYDYLAPERVAEGTPPDVSSDLYACGLLWWHLLAGRTPLAGGNARAKLHAAQAARIVEIRSLAQAIPASLAEAIDRCLEKERAKRPATFADLATQLGPPSLAGRELLASLMRSPSGTWQNIRPTRARRGRKNTLLPATIGAVCAAVLLLWVFVPRMVPAGAVPTEASSAQVAELPAPAADSPAPPRAEPAEVMVDHAVQPAAATVSPAGPAAAQRVVEDLVLPTGEVLHLDSLSLEPGLRVRGRGGRRPLVSVPARGILIDCENVTFEGVDFLWQTPAANGSISLAVPAAIFQLEAQAVSFRGCSFNARTSAPPVAIRTQTRGSKLGGIGFDLSFVDCVFDGLGAVIDHGAPESIATRLENCLGVASGPLVQLARCPTEDSGVKLVLDRVTTRGDTAVLRILNARGLGKPGPIEISASGCALAGTSRAGLISLIESGSPQSLLAVISWSGQGSVVSPRTPMLTTQAVSGDMTPVAEDQLAVAGLVRGELGFVGRADGPPADSRVVRWQVPLRSAEPPGADPTRLHSLRSQRDE